jgi:hypothetical protein
LGVIDGEVDQGAVVAIAGIVDEERARALVEIPVA